METVGAALAHGMQRPGEFLLHELLADDERLVLAMTMALESRSFLRSAVAVASMPTSPRSSPLLGTSTAR